LYCDPVLYQVKSGVCDLVLYQKMRIHGGQHDLVDGGSSYRLFPGENQFSNSLPLGLCPDAEVFKFTIG
jgi:hypothetical protein